MQKLELGSKEGHWAPASALCSVERQAANLQAKVMLQNIHLMPSWCARRPRRLCRLVVAVSSAVAHRGHVGEEVGCLCG